MARYGILLRCQQAGSGVDSSPDGNQDYHLVTDSELHGAFLTNEDGEPKFVTDNDEETQGIEQPDATVASFHSLGTSLTLEPLVHDVYVNSPPLPGLPASFAWGRVNVPATSKDGDGEKRRFIYLRPGDTVVFPAQSLQVAVVARDLDSLITAPSVDVQVKSSTAEAGTNADVSAVESGAALDGEETDDDDNLDSFNQDGHETPLINAGSVTPATSRPTEGAVAVKETPSRRSSNGENRPFSTAPDRLFSPQVQSSNNVPDTSTPAARAAESQEKRRQAQPEPGEDSAGESQYVFREQAKNQKTYGRRRKRISTPIEVAEVIESQLQTVQSPKKVNRASSPKYDQSSDPLDEAAAAMEVASRSRRSSRPSSNNSISAPTSASGNNKRKQPASDEEGSATDKEDAAGPPATKKTKHGNGRLPKAAFQEDATDGLGRASHPPSSGKLKKPTRSPADKERDDSIAAKPRKPQRLSSPHVQIPPHSSATASAASPSSTPSDSRPPTKLLLSASSHANKGAVKTFLTAQGLTISEKVPNKRIPFVCVVGNGALHTTVKLLRSLALNKKIATDQWLTDSLEAEDLLDPDDYPHNAIATLDRSRVFAGKTLYFTMTLQQSYGLAFKDVVELAQEAGATRVDYGSSARKAADVKDGGDVVFLGSVSGDAMAKELVRDFGKVVYTRDMLTQSIIRGELLLGEDELKIAGKAKKGRGR